MMRALLHSLRMAGDLLFYSAFASFFAACLGGQPAPLFLILSAVCYGVSACFSQRRVLRTICGVPALLGLLLVPGWVDRAACLPIALYILYLVWRGEYLLSADRQADVFLLFCKAYPVFAILLSLAWNGQVMLTVSLPLAVWAVLLQIFLMRILRQAPAIFHSPGYLLANAGFLLGLGGLGFLVSRPAVLGAAQAVVGAVYFGLVVPVLSVPMTLAARLVGWSTEHIVKPVLWAIFRWIGSQTRNQNQVPLASASGGSIQTNDFLPAAQPLLNGEQLLKGAGVLLLAMGCIILFRHLSQRNKAPLTGTSPAKTQQASHRARRRRPSFFLSPNVRVRRAYGRYLERQAHHGVIRQPSETSLDLLGRTPFLDPEAEQQLRRLYLKARYGEAATPQDAATAERLEKALEQLEENRP